MGVYLQTLHTLEREQFPLFIPVELASSLLGIGTRHIITGDRPRVNKLTMLAVPHHSVCDVSDTLDIQFGGEGYVAFPMSIYPSAGSREEGERKE